jgi:HK97 family phage portal protein
MSFIGSLFGVAFGPSQSSSGDGWISQGLFGVGGGPTFAGVLVDEQRALTFSAVYAAVSIIAEAVGMLPIDLMRKDGENSVEVTDHPVARVLKKPNPIMNAVDQTTAIQGHGLQYGNGYEEIQRTEGGEPIALWPLRPDSTSPVAVDRDSERRIVYQTTVGSEQISLEPSNVIHIRGLGFDGLRGYSPLFLARQGVGLGLALEEFGSKFFGNDAKSGGFLEHPGKLSDEAVARLQKQKEAQGGLSNAHRMKILEEGMKFNPTTISPEDSQFLMTRTFQVEEIARIYKVPLHMLQSQAKSTSWGSGIAQMSLGFAIYTLGVWLVRWEQELTWKLLKPEEIAQGYYIKINVNALLRADAKTRADVYTKALNTSTGWMSRNEVRALEDLNPDEIENTAPQPFGEAPPADDDDELEETDDELDEEE